MSESTRLDSISRGKRCRSPPGLGLPRLGRVGAKEPADSLGIELVLVPIMTVEPSSRQTGVLHTRSCPGFVRAAGNGWSGMQSSPPPILINDRTGRGVRDRESGTPRAEV